MATDRIDLTDRKAVAHFVQQSDALGGPEAPPTQQYWNQVECFAPGWVRAVAEHFDPLSETYFELQEQLYTSIVGRPYLELESELTQFDQESAARSLTAYPDRPPKNLNRYFHAMAKLADQIDGEGRCDILELGSGWGFSSEYMARLGHRVTAVDINPDFIAVASRRSTEARLGINYRQGSFEQLPLRPHERFDVVFCFEAFHHCRHSWSALQRMRDVLRPAGQIIFSGEPFISPAMWPSWGLRTDPLSVYCIAKFGWWESGWTVDFMADLFRRAGLQPTFVDFNTDLERYMVGRFGNKFGAGQLGIADGQGGWMRDATYLISTGRSKLDFYRSIKGASFSVMNFAARPLAFLLESPALAVPFATELAPGRNEVTVELSCPSDRWEMWLAGEVWNPGRELGNGDDRNVAFHLESIEEFP